MIAGLQSILHFLNGEQKMAMLFLETGDNWIISNDGAKVFGAIGDDSVILAAGVKEATVNANVDRVDFAGSLSDYRFVQSFGLLMDVYSYDGTLIATISVQEDENGTQLGFDDGSINAIYTGEGRLAVGGMDITTDKDNPTTIIPDTSVLEIAVTSANAGEIYTASGDVIETFSVDNDASYGYIIDNFEIGVDIIEMPFGTTLVNTALDGEVTLQKASDGIIVDITMIGLTDAQDMQLVSLADLGDSLVITDGGSGSAVDIDTGTDRTPVSFDAAGGSYQFMDDAAVSTFVVISNFSSDDTIIISNGDVSDYMFSNEGEDVTLSYNYNDEYIMNVIKLTGVVSNDTLVYDFASFTDAVGFDAFGVGSGDKKLLAVDIDRAAFPTQTVFDANGDAFNFVDDAAISNYAVIDNFTADDTISFINGNVSDYMFFKEGEDVTLSYNYNDEGTMNVITLTGIVSSDGFVYDLSSFTDAAGFDAFG
jgi:hypothetical protein